jgi:tRNA-Thr(GGU) m(6)t(6)A37 methyltransferase TsaA
MQSLTVKPIGVVHSEVKEKQNPGFEWQKVVAEIVVNPELAEGLDGIEEFSHVMVICWMDRATDPAKMALKVHPRGRHDLPPVGLFASRSPYRPNPLGKTTVRLLEHNGNTLKVKGLDAIDGTPVIDIKPYIPDYDSAQDAMAPKWTKHHRPQP